MSSHTISLSTTGTVVVAAQSVTGPYLNLTGTLTGNVTLDFGPGAGFWLVSVPAALNLAGHTLTFGSGSGTVTPIATGQVYTVLTLGANLIFATSVAASAVTVAGGTGVSVTGGPAYTVTNTGVTSAIAGTGIGVSGATGAVTFSLSTPVTVPNGGSGAATFTANGVLYGNGTSAFGVVSPVSSTGLALVGAGTGAPPAYGAISLASTAVTGVLAVTNGGTGQNTFTAHTLLVGNGAATINTAGPGTALAPLISGGGAADPSYTALTLSSGAAVTGVLGVANGGTGDSTLAAFAVLLGAGTGGVAGAAPGAAGGVLTSNGASANPSFLPVPSASNDTGSTVSITNANFTMIRAVTLTALSGQFALISAAIEITVVAATGATYGIGVDSTTASTSPVHTITNSGGGNGGAAGAIVYKTASLSAGSHTFNLIAQSSTFNVSDTASGSILVQLVNS